MSNQDEGALELRLLELFSSEQEISGSLDLSLLSKVNIYSTNGGITICGWDRSDFRAILKVKVRAENEEHARERALRLFIIKSEPGMLLMDGTAFKEHNESLSLELFLPQAGRYQVDAQSINGGVKMLDLVSPKVSLETMNGAVRADNVSAEYAELTTINGAIDCVGNVTHLRAVTTNGSIHIQPSGTEQHSCELRTTTGAISVKVDDAQNLAHDLDLKTSMGSIKADLPGIKITSKHALESQTPDFEIQPRKLQVEAITTLGSITISRV